MPSPLPNELQEALAATEVCVGNPFATPGAQLDDAYRYFQQHSDEIPDLSFEFCERSLPDASRRLLLAVGNWWTFTRPDKRVLPVENTISTAHGREIGVRPVDLRRLFGATHRFYAEMRHFVGVSAAVQKVRIDAWSACFGRSLVDTLAYERAINEQNVLILGESGTGKEIVARAIQRGHLGPPDGEPPPCPAVNGAAIPTGLAESELFGHTKGAFTDAKSTRVGKIQEADHGTLFIDEVADLPALVQPKLLRVIELDILTPVGSNRNVEVHVRYVTATSKPIKELARRDEFRPDLYERLAGVILRLPPLRDRREDIEPIARAIVRRRFDDSDVLASIEISVLGWLAANCRDVSWEGNVRELAAAIGNHLLGIERSFQVNERTSVADALALPERILNCQATEEEVCEWYLKRVLSAVSNNHTQAERILGLNRSTIHRRVSELERRR